MKIFKHDFFTLSDKDKKIIEKWNIKYMQKGEMSSKDMFSPLSNKYYSSQTIQHYISLFPNNFLLFINFIADYENVYKKKLDDFEKILNDQQTTERLLLNHINNTESHFIISSLLMCTDFGHHDAYIFPEFSIGTEYKTDYLVVGKNSHGYHFLFVELENPFNNVTQKDGSFGQTLRKGINQIADWGRYIEKNFSSISSELNKYKGPSINLPEEFYHFDSTRMNFVVVAGRRADFNEKTYYLKRKELKNNGLLVLHYDNLIDCASKAIKHGKVCG